MWFPSSLPHLVVVGLEYEGVIGDRTDFDRDHGCDNDYG